MQNITLVPQIDTKPLFNFFSEEHGLFLTESELIKVINLVLANCIKNDKSPAKMVLENLLVRSRALRKEQDVYFKGRTPEKLSKIETLGKDYDKFTANISAKLKML